MDKAKSEELDKIISQGESRFMAPKIIVKGPVLLLMGPIGTFFSRIAAYLEGNGVEVYKVCFPLWEHGFRQRQRIHFSGRVETEFEPFLRKTLRDKQIKHILMYGDFIIPHRIAINVARECGIEIEAWIFELGYLRPNYVTLEQNSVNCRSNLNKPPSFYSALPEPETLPQARQDIGPRWRKAWKAPTFISHALTNYKVCESAHKLQPKPSYILAQVRGFTRKYIYLLTERSTRKKLYVGTKFFLAVLQVSTDSQLYNGSPYRNISDFIEHVIASFAAKAPREMHLMIKHHPRDRGYNNYKEAIEAIARAHDCLGRVFYFHDAPLGKIFRGDGCHGCILINSSVGFQALYHGIPLKTLGQAPYNIEGLADQQDLDSFWQSPKVSDRALFRRFYQHTLDTTQINGNFDGRFPFKEVFVNPESETSRSLASLKTHARASQSCVYQIGTGLRIVGRLVTLFEAYILYALHWVAIAAGRKYAASRLFEKSAKGCLRALGIRVLIDRRDGTKSRRAEINIANHESALDVLLVHGYYRMPATTTAQLHLRWLIPGFRHAARRYGHILLDHRCFRSRISALRKSRQTLSTFKQFFIFPSGSLKTTIQERFSPSIAFLARQNDALVIPWRIYYETADDSRSQAFPGYNPIRLLLSRLLGPDMIINCIEGPAFDPRDFASDGEMTIAMQGFYKGINLTNQEDRKVSDDAVA